MEGENVLNAENYHNCLNYLNKQIILKNIDIFIDNSGLNDIIPFLTVRRAKKAEKRDSHAKKIILSFLPRFPKLS